MGKKTVGGADTPEILESEINKFTDEINDNPRKFGISDGHIVTPKDVEKLHDEALDWKARMSKKGQQLPKGLLP